MKLNLLPTYAAKEGQARSAIVFSIVFALVSIVIAVFLITSSSAELAAVKENVAQAKASADRAVAEGKKADAIMQDVTGIERNVNLALSMQLHNFAYVDLYREVFPYIPSFFRVTNLSAQPSGPTGCNISMTGTIHTHQQYADLMLALLRVPGATNVSRSGYTVRDPFVPNLVREDQVGRMVKPNAGRVPSDGLERLNYLIARANAEPQGYRNHQGYGSPNPDTRGAMPEWSEITVTVSITGRNIRTPDPRATLTAQGGAGAPGGAGAAGFGGVPAGGGGAVRATPGAGG